jgi:hypothetical protein
MALRCGWWVRPPAPHSYASRLSLITYPELFICSKAGECKTRGYCEKFHDSHRMPHKHSGSCKKPCDRDGTCIPYVPEDEADWFVVSKGEVGIGTATQRLVREQDARQVLATDSLNRRAFKWSTGLKGTSCE